MSEQLMRAAFELIRDKRNQELASSDNLKAVTKITNLHYAPFCEMWKAAQQAAEPSVPGWISVGERLPDDGQRVLVLNKDSRVDLCRRTEWNDKSRGDTFYLWELDDDESYYSNEEVTHWIPLPAAQVKAQEKVDG